jgi:hypothetical protein
MIDESFQVVHNVVDEYGFADDTEGRARYRRSFPPPSP